MSSIVINIMIYDLFQAIMNNINEIMNDINYILNDKKGHNIVNDINDKSSFTYKPDGLLVKHLNVMFFILFFTFRIVS